MKFRGIVASMYPTWVLLSETQIIGYFSTQDEATAAARKLGGESILHVARILLTNDSSFWKRGE